MTFNDSELKITVVGLGYVGLPLACLLAKKHQVTGFDINKGRIAELNDGVDRTGEVTDTRELEQNNLAFSCDPKVISQSNLIIVAVPTPITDYKQPDLSPVEKASRLVGQFLKKDSIVVFESTVYPGVTEDFCRPIIEEESKLTHLEDFWLGYSPERVNPGDRVHTIDKIVKVVSGSTPEVKEFLGKVYSSVITAGVHLAPSIKTAEASKVIENTQRDLNIAIINELSQIFEKIDLDTHDVLEAAGTKWNFLKFTPGLVGGHCIGVDPYYLSYLAEGHGIHAQLIQAGRRINDGMAENIAHKCKDLLLTNAADLNGAPKIGILGVTFKENVPDTRNTKVVQLGNILEQSGCKVQYVDSLADAEAFSEEYEKEIIDWDSLDSCDAIIVAVKHDHLTDYFEVDMLCEKLTEAKIVIDLKNVVDRTDAKKAGLRLWRV